jgi:hypothetical protein
MWGGLLICTGPQQKVTALDNFQTSRKLAPRWRSGGSGVLFVRRDWAAFSRLSARRLPVWLRRTKAIGGLAANGKLKDRRSLATGKQGHQYFPPIRKFECVVVSIGEMRVDDTKSRHAKARALGPYPSVIEPNVFIESQFGAK